MSEPIQFPKRPRVSPQDEIDSAAKIGLAVGQNIKRLRSGRGLSLENLSKLSGVSRAMLGQIELGRSIPTINVVWKVARAFDVPFAALIAISEAPKSHVMRVADSKLLTSANGGFSSRALFPFELERKTEFYELRLKPKALEKADAHATGTQENMVVVSGRLEVDIDGERQTLEPGDSILFRADQPHSYRNLSNKEAVIYLVMTYPEPVG